MLIGSLFSGIGGLELGLERAGLGKVVWQVESDPWCRGVLARHWPAAKRYDDVRAVRGSELGKVGLLCGGFPCQDVSVAGQRKGVEHGTQSGLWTEYFRLIRETEAGIAVIENVPGLRTRGLRRVLADLASIGMDACWTTLGAWEVAGVHRRDRLFVVAAYPDRLDLRLVAERMQARRFDVQASRQAQPGHDGSPRDAAHAYGLGREALTPARLHGDGAFGNDAPGCRGSEGAGTAGSEVEARAALLARWAERLGRDAPEPVVRRVDDGAPGGVVDSDERLRALGNAVVPQCAEVIGRILVDAIALYEGRPL